ncbi:DsbA family protein [Microbacterium aoyamense]|uniref:DsbA family protein n=1 Tax=Microbacterium aoyamense TaxID=344166 RepID=A0ABP5BA55_9MICO|nr:thioredoxin domain-containing protein [Microbacterium aoyamense]
MNRSLKVTVVTGTILGLLMLVGLIFFLVNQSLTSPPQAEGEEPQVVRASSHVLDEGGDGAVTIVEFLDFECEACGAFYPLVEDLREQYAGKITYIVRYFPLPGHTNSTNAALAVEAAAQQGRFEDMYHRLFETQTEWGEAQESRADVFRDFAEELGLDMDAYDTAIADPVTLARVKLDFDEGSALGVRSTPTFFLDGEQLTIEDWDDLPNAIEDAVNGAGR